MGILDLGRDVCLKLFICLNVLSVEIGIEMYLNCSKYVYVILGLSLIKLFKKF